MIVTQWQLLLIYGKSSGSNSGSKVELVVHEFSMGLEEIQLARQHKPSKKFNDHPAVRAIKSYEQGLDRQMPTSESKTR